MWMFMFFFGWAELGGVGVVYLWGGEGVERYCGHCGHCGSRGLWGRVLCAAWGFLFVG